MTGVDAKSALFLDFDGTLVDIVERPEAVSVEPGLVELLASLQRQLGGALAIVSGRPLAQIDAFLAPLALPAAGVHGTERRRADGVLQHLPVDAIDDELAAPLQALADAHPGVLLERKTGSLALHYRLAPQCEALCLAAARRIVDTTAGLALLHGKCVAEIKSALVGKGRAIDAFLAEPPFIGRHAVFAGDDTTDEAGFAAVQARGGIGIKVGEGPSLAQQRLLSPAAMRDWLRELDRHLASPSAKRPPAA